MDERHRTLYAIKQEGVSIRSTPEDQKNSRFERDRRNVEHLFEVPPHLFLSVVPLKRPARRKYSIAIGLGFSGIGGRADEDGDAQARLRKLECLAQRIGTLGRPLDHIEHVPEVDHRRAVPRFVRLVCRIPTVRDVAEGLQKTDIVAKAAAVVEERVFRCEDAVADKELHRPGEVRSCYRGSVTSDFHVLLTHAQQPVTADHQSTPLKLA